MAVGAVTLAAGAGVASSCSTHREDVVGSSAAPLTTFAPPVYAAALVVPPNTDGSAPVGADLVARNTSTAIIAPVTCLTNCNLRRSFSPQLDFVTAFEVLTTRSLLPDRGVWVSISKGDGSSPGISALGGNNPNVGPSPSGWSARNTGNWGGLLAQPHVVSLGVPGHVAIVSICGDDQFRFTDVCLTISTDSGHSWSGTFFVNPADKAGFALGDAGTGVGIRDVAAAVTYFETNDNPQYPGALGDHNLYISWQAWDDHHYIARVILNAALTPALTLVNDMNLGTLDSDVNILGMHAPPNCGSPVDQVLVVWPAFPTRPTQCQPGNPGRDPGSPTGTTAQFWKTKFANIWTTNGGAVWSGVTNTPTDDHWPFCVGDDGRFANSARASLAFVAEPNVPSGTPYVNDVLIAAAVSNLGNATYPAHGWVPAAAPGLNQGTVVQFVTTGPGSSCAPQPYVPGPPPANPPPYTGPGDSGIVGVRQDEFLPSLSTVLYYGNGTGSSIYRVGLTWLDSRDDPAQTNMPCGVVARTVGQYAQPPPFGTWTTGQAFFGPLQQVMGAGCFDENFNQNRGDRLGRYNESSFQVVDWKYPAGSIITAMGMGFSNGQNFLSQPVPPNPGPAPGSFTQGYTQ